MVPPSVNRHSRPIWVANMECRRDMWLLLSVQDIQYLQRRAVVTSEREQSMSIKALGETCPCRLLDYGMSRRQAREGQQG